MLRVALLLGIASALGGLAQVRFEQYDRLRRARAEEYLDPGAWFISVGVALVCGSIIIHRRWGAPRFAPLVPRHAEFPLALGWVGLALALHCGLHHYGAGGHAAPVVDPRILVLDTVALYLLAASLAWSLFLPQGRLVYPLCSLFAVAVGRASGVSDGYGLLFAAAAILLWIIGAASLLTVRWDAPPRHEDGAPV